MTGLQPPQARSAHAVDLPAPRPRHPGRPPVVSGGRDPPQARAVPRAALCPSDRKNQFTRIPQPP